MWLGDKKMSEKGKSEKNDFTICKNKYFIEKIKKLFNDICYYGKCNVNYMHSKYFETIEYECD